MRICRLALLVALLTACSKPAAPPVVPSPAAAPTVATGALPPTASAATRPGSQEGESPDSFFNAKNYPDAVTGGFVDPKSLSPTELKYGMAPKHDARVVYQDDVIVMEHGDQAIRDAKSDGMTFSLDASAEHVAEFAEGKIMFATGRVVGRIGQVLRNGDTVTVKLVPVQITEIIKKGTFLLRSDFKAQDLIIHTAPDFPNTLDYSDKEVHAEALERHTWRTDDADGWGFLHTQGVPTPPGTPTPPGVPSPPGVPNVPNVPGVPNPPGIPTPPPVPGAALPSGLGKDLSTHWQVPEPTGAPVNLSAGLKVVPAIGSDGGIGINFSYMKNGVVFNAYGQIVLPTPHIDFLLKIDTGGIETFGIQITGSVGLRIAIDGYADVERYINANSTTVTPLDLSLPCPIAGIPLELSFKTSFNLHTKFAAKTSTLSTKGQWDLTGTLFAGYKNNSQSHSTPPSKNTSSLATNLSGASVGINQLGGAIKVTPMIGLGGFGFMTGVYLGITFTGDVVKQSSIAMVDCHGASGSATIDSGVGYQLPGPFVDFINSILSLFTHYRMDKSGTLKKGWGGQLFKINEDFPTNCAGLSDAAPASPGPPSPSAPAPAPTPSPAPATPASPPKSEGTTPT